MKKFLLASVAILGACGIAWALQSTPTPIVAPETGEASQHQAEVLDMARFKPGMCTTTATGSGAAAGTETATCNGASGQVTTVTLTIATVGAKNTLTITNNKVGAGDACIATLDPLATAAGALPVVANCSVTANTLTIILSNLLAVSPAGAVEVAFLVLTSGNPN
jgi:hypothetical protein